VNLIADYAVTAREIGLEMGLWAILNKASSGALLLNYFNEPSQPSVSNEYTRSLSAWNPVVGRNLWILNSVGVSSIYNIGEGEEALRNETCSGPCS